MVPERAPGVRRVLVVTYYFPPSGGPGVQRVLKFVKYLREFGYEPTVLTVEEGAFPQHDEELVTEIPPGVAIHRTRSLDPFGVYAFLTGRSKKDAVMVGTVRREGGFIERAASWMRANVFLPDARVGWVPFAVREGIRLHREQRFDVVFTSGPPHSVHLIGKKLKRRVGIPWVADFRDLWSDTNFYDELPITSIARAHDRRLEQRVLSEADRIVTVSPYWKRILVEKSGRQDDELVVVHNGFDETDFETHTEPAGQNAGLFTLAHVGSLYGARNPEVLWAAIKGLRDKGDVERLRIRLIGIVDNRVHEAIAANGLEAIVDATPYVSHSGAVKAMCSASALLLVIERFQNDAGMITGKLYEYLAAGRPVVGVGPTIGDAADLLASTSAGRMIDRSDVDGLAEHLKILYQQWESGAPLQGAASEDIRLYSRREQTRVLAVALDAIT